MHQSVETLTTFNEYSSNTYNTLNKDFEKHTKMLKEMKKDLNVIFKRIRYHIVSFDLTNSKEHCGAAFTRNSLKQLVMISLPILNKMNKLYNNSPCFPTMTIRFF